MTDMERREDHWSLDKRIPISVMALVLIQSAGLIIWGSKLDSRVAALEQSINDETSRRILTNLPDRITRLEVEQRYTMILLQDIAKDVKEIRKGQ